MVLLSATLPFTLAPGAARAASLAPWLAAALGLVPSWFILGGLGAYTLPSGLAFVCLIGLTPGATAWTLAPVAACLAFMFWLRPEGQLLAVLCLPALATFFPTGMGMAMAMAGLAVGLIVWRHLPAVVDRLPPSFKNLIVFYLRYDPDTGVFRQTYQSTGYLMQRFNDVSIHDPNALAGLVNDNLAVEIKAHPWAFLRYLADKMAMFCRVVVMTYTVPLRPAYDWIPTPLAVAFVAGLFALGLGVPASAPALGVCFLYLLSSAIFNDLWVRHLMIITPVLTIYCLARLLPGQALDMPGWLAWAGFGAAASLSCWLARIRMHHDNAGYRELFHLLRPEVTPDTVVLNTYPQLFAFELGCRSRGSVFLVETLEYYIRRFRPRFIVIDTVRDPRLARRLRERFGEYVPGYAPWASSPRWGVIYAAISDEEAAGRLDP